MKTTNLMLAAVIIASSVSSHIVSKGAKKVSKKEYAALVAQCKAIAERILRENSFEPIKQQALSQFKTQTLPSITERFTAVPGGQRSSAFQAAINGSGEDFQRSLAVLETQHNQQLMNLINNTIASYLSTIGTPAAKQLLADLIAGKPVL